MKKTNLIKTCLGVSAGLLISANSYSASISPEAVLNHYADLAQVMYGDALSTATSLQTAVNHFVATPTEANMDSAKAAWVAARHPYQQTEAYRFGNAIVDDWEGKVNAWPLDEGLIDYVATSYGAESDENPFYSANIIANTQLTIGGVEVDASTIDKAFLSETLHEIDEVESNVATGYHAIEFLLWGQDLNGTNAGAGARPASDFSVENCSWGNCQRRADYLTAATDLLIDDLQWMISQWDTKGDARKAVTEGASDQALATIFVGMGSLSYGELAGERMKLGVMLHDPEEEHDCFSDNTHWSHYNDALGIKNVYTGSYTRVDGSVFSGPSLSDLVRDKSAEIDDLMRAKLAATMGKMDAIVSSAKQGTAYDQLLAAGNESGNAMVYAAVDALVDQTRAIEKAVNAMNLNALVFEGSDSLDQPSVVQ
ncbi:MAG: imelysin family protein [Arenicellales bacterium]